MRLSRSSVVGDRAQDVVSRLVALAVVERLEVIEVAEQHAVGVAIADSARVVGHEILLEPQPVPEPGERIATRLLGERELSRSSSFSIRGAG